MGQAKRRRDQLGATYGTPETSNRQQVLDGVALRRIRSAMASGHQVVVVGTAAARPLVEAVGLPWLHELPEGAPMPRHLAWDPELADAGGPLLPPSALLGATVVIGAGGGEWAQGAMDSPPG